MIKLTYIAVLVLVALSAFLAYSPWTPITDY
jgi:hypothetical protein